VRADEGVCAAAEHHEAEARLAAEEVGVDLVVTEEAGADRGVDSAGTVEEEGSRGAVVVVTVADGGVSQVGVGAVTRFLLSSFPGDVLYSSIA
jgi:hypothetical protein